MIDLKDRYKGCLVGLAVGDALGVPLEFCKRGFLPKVTEMIGQGPFWLAPGEWTDDTSMALCLANSLIEKQRFDEIDQLDKYCKWMDEGYMSVTGKLFDIGDATADALCNYKKTGISSGNTHEKSCGNGSIMRLAPIPMVYRDKNDLFKLAMDSSKTTHAHKKCMYSCAFFAYLINLALNGESKDKILESYTFPFSMEAELENVIAGSYKNKTEDQIKSSGYVIDTLEAALWAFYTTDSFEDGCIKVVNLGDDSDTVGAVYGQIAGAYYGYSNIPTRWLDKLSNRQMIEDISIKLYNLHENKSTES